MESQIFCRMLIVTSSGNTQGLACAPTHRTYVGRKNRQNILSSSAPSGSGATFLRGFLFEVGVGDNVKSLLNLCFRETCRSRDNIQASKNQEQGKKNFMGAFAVLASCSGTRLMSSLMSGTGSSRRWPRRPAEGRVAQLPDASGCHPNLPGLTNCDSVMGWIW